MRVLIVLDDVEYLDHIKAFGVNLQCFGLGSRIILITQSPELLDEAKVSDRYIVDSLSEPHALRLFLWHAFGKNSPKGEYRYLSAEIASSTGGIPLIIELVGSHLSNYRNRERERWEEVLMQLRNCDNEPLARLLDTSCGKLQRGQRQIYLDIACFLMGENNTIASYMWRACGLCPIDARDKLVGMSLLKIGENDEMLMSHPIREYGRNLVLAENTEPEMRSRLWIHKEALKVLKMKKGSDKIKAMCLQFGNGLDESLTGMSRLTGFHDQVATSPSFGYFQKFLKFLKSVKNIPTNLPLLLFSSSGDILDPSLLMAENFTSLNELRFLRLGKAKIRGDFENLLPKLRWLDWKNCPEILDEVQNLYLEYLVILDMSCSNVTQDWSGWNPIKEKAKNLKVLLLTECHRLHKSPSFPECRELERLDFERCSQLRSISIPFSTIKTLVYLNMKGCNNFTKLPEDLCSMVALKTLIVDGTSITKINIGREMKALENLSACCCKGLKVIDSSIGELKSLTHLSLDDSGIEMLPDSIGSLPRLQTLSLRNCKKVKKLPRTVGHLTSLVKMDLTYTVVRKLPPEVRGLKSLQDLLMAGTSLPEFPTVIANLTSLKKIDLSLCRSMKGEIPDSINNLSSLKTLLLSATKISSLPTNTSGVSQLQVLDLRLCENLQGLPSLPSSLTSLSMGSHNMSNIPNLSYMTNLTELHVADNSDEHSEVVTDERIPQPWPAGSFHWITNLSKLEALDLYISKAHSLPNVFNGLLKLRKLVLSCRHLECLPRLPSSLTTLHIKFCKSLSQYEDLSYLTCLSKLEMVHCGVRSINLMDLSELLVLKISDCRLEQIIGIHGLSSLKMFEMSNCPRFSPDEMEILKDQGVEVLHEGLEFLSNI